MKILLIFCRNELQLQNLNEPNIFMTPLQRVSKVTSHHWRPNDNKDQHA